MEHIKFNYKEIVKSEFFDWLTSTLEEHGWVSVASNPAVEGWIYHSKGESGNDNILFNFRDGYDGHNVAQNRFTTTSSMYTDMRMMISYIPNEEAGKNGVHVPYIHNDSFSRISIGSRTVGGLYPDSKLKLHYICNKNRIIFLVSTYATTTFFMIGKPNKNYAKEYSNTGNMLFTTNSYRAGNINTWGIADRPTTTASALLALYNPIDNGFYGDKLLFCEVGFGSALEGIKGFLEGIYYIPTTGKSGYNSYTDGDKFIDASGNEYTLFYMAPTPSNYPLSLGSGFITVCTKLAGEA